MMFHIKLVGFIALLVIANTASAQAVRTIAVTGEATHQVTPDAFKMHFTFERRGEDLVGIKQKVDDDVLDATKMLLALSVKEENIRSMDVTVYPWFENKEQQRTQRGFVYRRTVYFTHHDIDAFDALIEQVSALKPQQISQLELINTNIEKIKRELTNEALKDAREKAKEMAKVMDMEVGHVMFMSDGTNPPEHMFESRGRMLMATASDGSPSLPGENTIRTQVEVVFELFTVSHTKR
ncbi:SIMPL domain-containing protein [Glaciecola sp. XM2]|uniref:SIMPL domain-containing protein n=1 Tax=Glaciecola sp. XM2 TaxID=1914931 RepID=UPI001BDDEC36|nr:SIMPL domain-containing protein [Glaciecola sp. XM2]MBT1449702.1 SIMPL domain-containing protein [Glaciecola sp. XM2]